jgi:hypothetical protein
MAAAATRHWNVPRVKVSSVIFVIHDGLLSMTRADRAMAIARGRFLSPFGTVAKSGWAGLFDTTKQPDGQSFRHNAISVVL